MSDKYEHLFGPAIHPQMKFENGQFWLVFDPKELQAAIKWNLAHPVIRPTKKASFISRLDWLWRPFSNA